MASGRKLTSQFQQMRSVMGPCLVIFGLPLTIPGTAITIVPFYDETGFSKYGGLHIMGFFILFLSVGFIVSGCVLNCMRKATISPLEQVHLVSPWGTPRHNHRAHTKEELIPCTAPSEMT